MRRIGIVFALAMFASSFGFMAAPASADPGHMMGHRCPRGSHWVASHRNRMGHWVRGHCSNR